MQKLFDGVISKKVAVAIIVGQAVANSTVAGHYLRKLEKHANEIIEDQGQQINILKEALNFLLDNGNIDPVAMAELNKNLDFWRVVRGIPAPPEEEAS